MTEFKHTPGPWKWNKGYAGLNGPDGQGILPYESYENMWVPYYDENGLNNARIIEASPELLEGCKQSLKALMNIVPFADDMTDTGCEAISEANGLIVKLVDLINRIEKESKV